MGTFYRQKMLSISAPDVTMMGALGLPMQRVGDCIHGPLQHPGTAKGGTLAMEVGSGWRGVKRRFRGGTGCLLGEGVNLLAIVPTGSYPPPPDSSFLCQLYREWLFCSAFLCGFTWSHLSVQLHSWHRSEEGTCTDVWGKYFPLSLAGFLMLPPPQHAAHTCMRQWGGIGLGCKLKTTKF